MPRGAKFQGPQGLKFCIYEASDGTLQLKPCPDTKQSLQSLRAPFFAKRKGGESKPRRTPI